VAARRSPPPDAEGRAISVRSANTCGKRLVNSEGDTLSLR